MKPNPWFLLGIALIFAGGIVCFVFLPSLNAGFSSQEPVAQPDADS
jgi:hypothetical protein